MPSEKDQLVSQNPQQRDPYRAQASEFPSKRVTGAFGQSVDAPGQKNKLADQSRTQEAPWRAETDGGASDSFSDAAKNKQSFSVGTNAGESSTGAGAVSIPESVDCKTGKIISSGYNATPQNELHDKWVRIGG